MKYRPSFGEDCSVGLPITENMKVFLCILTTRQKTCTRHRIGGCQNVYNFVLAWRVPRAVKRSGITACHKVAAHVITHKRVPREIGGNNHKPMLIRPECYLWAYTTLCRPINVNRRRISADETEISHCYLKVDLRLHRSNKATSDLSLTITG